MLWLVYGALSTIEVPHMLMNVIIADGFSILLNGVMTFLLYYFKRDFERKKLIYVAAGVLATWIISAVLVVIWVWYPTIRISSNAALVFSLIAPTFTTFAFVPQLIQSIKTKNWRGVSHWMILLFVVNNIVWNIFWISNIVINSQAQKGITDLIGALIWQTVSLIIYTYQYGATLYYNKKNLNNNENTKKVA
ncbi:PQ-loop domain-containing transporter [Mycoplasmopsis alligatoris]|uniref:PQ-loop domain-containing transporter n=1 Tax=Mycoplasmopsis alligatoris TaxID=47687 RepID=UPI001EEA3184|nr:PQ-loop domain-containing transporter [Mycoplasmopsis alligatoris]